MHKAYSIGITTAMPAKTLPRSQAPQIAPLGFSVQDVRDTLIDKFSGFDMLKQLTL